MKFDTQKALEPLPCQFAILTDKFVIFVSRKMLHCTKIRENSFLSCRLHAQRQ